MFFKNMLVVYLSVSLAHITLVPPGPVHLATTPTLPVPIPLLDTPSRLITLTLVTLVPPAPVHDPAPPTLPVRVQLQLLLPAGPGPVTPGTVSTSGVVVTPALLAGPVNQPLTLLSVLGLSLLALETLEPVVVVGSAAGGTLPVLEAEGLGRLRVLTLTTLVAGDPVGEVTEEAPGTGPVSRAGFTAGLGS